MTETAETVSLEDTDSVSVGCPVWLRTERGEGVTTLGEASRRRRMAGKPAPYALDVRTGEKMAAKHAGLRLGAYVREVLASAVRGDVESKVPCGTCRECCWHHHVEVRPELGDDLAYLDTVRQEDGELVLRKREDGACVHLTDAGCGVYEHRPMVCRGFDCRMLGAVGLVEHYDNGHATPVWVFVVDSPEERVIELALKMAAMPVIAANPTGDSAWDAAAAAWRYGPNYLQKAREFVASFDRLPLAERRRLAEELYSSSTPNSG